MTGAGRKTQCRLYFPFPREQICGDIYGNHKIIAFLLVLGIPPGDRFERMLQNRRSNASNFRPWLSQAQTSPPLLLQRHRGWALSRHGQRVPQPRVWSQVLLSELKAHLLMLQNLRPPVVPRILPTSRKLRVYLSSIYSYIQVLSVL